MLRSYFIHVLRKKYRKREKIKRDSKKSIVMAHGPLNSIIYTSNSFLRMKKCLVIKNREKRVGFS